MKINKTANTNLEKIILDYLESLDAPELITKINSSDKDIPDAVSYCAEQCRQKATKHGSYSAYGGTDAELFGMVVHYFEEDSIKKGSVSVPKNVKVVASTPKPKAEAPKVEKPKPAPKVVKDDQLEGQLSLF